MVIAVIVPFLNEESVLPISLLSIAAQTRPPDRLLLVDNGSADHSLQLAEAFARDHPWTETLVVSRPAGWDRDRLIRANELRAFHRGLERLDGAYDVVVKLDADIELSPRTVEAIEQALQGDPGLGIVGTHLSERDQQGRLRRLPSRPEHVHGATKFYRRECLEEISPLPEMIGWDVIDGPRARLRGWRTQSIDVPGGDPLHLRPMGHHDGRVRALSRWGLCAYVAGEDPLHTVLLGVRRMREPPGVVGGLAYVVGFAGGWLRRLPRAEPAVRTHVRREQRRRMVARLKERRPSASGLTADLPYPTRRRSVR